jgi:hypothetical protein
VSIQALWPDHEAIMTSARSGANRKKPLHFGSGGLIVEAS